MSQARHASDVRIHYVVGGDGPAIVLLHGFPQHWHEWRHVMPLLVDAGYMVIAPDLRGFGLSDKPLEGYDVGTVGEDIRQVIRQLKYENVVLVGHDVDTFSSRSCCVAPRPTMRSMRQ
jgi:pimeloyl-ACP methyl ester carboxylesterase